MLASNKVIPVTSALPAADVGSSLYLGFSGDGVGVNVGGWGSVVGRIAATVAATSVCAVLITTSVERAITVCAAAVAVCAD